MEVKIMNRQKNTQIVLGVTAVCVILFGVMLQSALDWGTAQATDTGGALFLPVVMKPFPFINRVSVTSDGTQGNMGSRTPSISANGRYIAYGSEANNLVSGDTNVRDDVFIHDRQTGQTSRISIASDGTQGNDASGNPSISADGRFIAFYSGANNLVSSDVNNCGDVFVFDRQTSQTSLISVSSDGTQGNGGGWTPSISADGRYVAFESGADNLVEGDTNDYIDIFVHNRQSGQTSRVSVANNGIQGNENSSFPSISADARYVAFTSYANNLVNDDTNGTFDIFVYDRQAGQINCVSVASDGTLGNGPSWAPSISADGRYVAFESHADNLVNNDMNGSIDVFVHDLLTGITSLVSVASNGTQGNDNSWWDRASISADGRYVAFDSLASNLVSGDTNGNIDVFLHDRQTGQTSLVSMASDGIHGNSSSTSSYISADGCCVTFTSLSSNLVNGDTNDIADIFVQDRGE
jgi:Tol biopolymer transport system component